jgi:AcrR family transcriptional regulator
MDQVYVVRHKVLAEGMSAREVARELGISRNTVRRYAEGAEPGARRQLSGRPQPRLDPVRERLGALGLHSSCLGRRRGVNAALRLPTFEWRRQGAPLGSGPAGISPRPARVAQPGISRRTDWWLRRTASLCAGDAERLGRPPAEVSLPRFREHRGYAASPAGATPT